MAASTSTSPWPAPRAGAGSTASRGKEKVLALGLYPDVSLANAREARDDAQRLLAGGIHPGAQKKVPSSPTPPSVQTRKPMDAHGVPSQLCLQVTFAFWVADYPSPSTH
ncbi:Arm DNA-binding domain-containing protein [Nocardiopsis yanglingensis]